MNIDGQIDKCGLTQTGKSSLTAEKRGSVDIEHYCTISTVGSRILKICWLRWPINFLLNSSDFKWGLFLWLLRVTELTVEMVQ